MQGALIFIVALASAWYTYRNFGEAFPITALSITADQHAARAAAWTLRSQLQANQALALPALANETREASSFQLD
eukprot:2935815-Prymnesium_polylepis.1